MAEETKEIIDTETTGSELTASKEEQSENTEPQAASTEKAQQTDVPASEEAVTAAGEQDADQPTLFDAEITDEQLMAAIEAILFSMGESVEISALAKALEVRTNRIKQALKKLQKKYDAPSRGITLQQFDDAVQMSTKPEQYENLIKIAKVPKKMTLSDSVIETLSIVAYKQPITKIEVQGIRGVSCDYAINKLLEYDLIKELGRKDAPGRPILFGTTEQFLRSFGVKNLAELPSLNTVKVEEFKEEAEAEIDDRLGI